MLVKSSDLIFKLSKRIKAAPAVCCALIILGLGVQTFSNVDGRLRGFTALTTVYSNSPVGDPVGGPDGYEVGIVSSCLCKA